MQNEISQREKTFGNIMVAFIITIICICFLDGVIRMFINDDFHLFGTQGPRGNMIIDSSY